VPRDVSSQFQRLSRSSDAVSSMQDKEAGIEIQHNSGSRQKGSWIGKPRNERRQSCRRVNSRRDWSRELEESDYKLPFPVAIEETERGGGSTRRTVSFRDEVEERLLPRLETLLGGDQLVINMGQVSAELGSTDEQSVASASGTDASFETECSGTESE